MNPTNKKKIDCRVVVVVYHSLDQQRQTRNEIMKDMLYFMKEQNEAEERRAATAEKVMINIEEQI
jgi:hypothetical protein